PAFVADDEGKPMHSWRVLILPFIEQQPLYDQYDFSEPWNGPHNADHGQPPEQLVTLVPEYLLAVPEDPFSGRTLIYRAESPNFVVYSVGRDRRDDGGRPAVPFGDGDLFLDPPASVPSEGGTED
ncbi:MAG TPA: DUF1559 domain-containing protein, partial [Pirellulales bacterium]|nr:DUF1559 domain-containing protein [Pirellulales bacterium]